MKNIKIIILCLIGFIISGFAGYLIGIQKSVNLNKNMKGILMAKQIWTDADLDNCILFQTVVEVSFGGELADEGLIQDYTDESVKINGCINRW